MSKTNDCVYSIVVKQPDGIHKFLGTFNDRKILFDTLKLNVDLENSYIKGETKKLKITLITLYNGLMDDAFIIYKDDEEGNPSWYIKILTHKINVISPYFN
jgi:uncharacterized protein YueI